MKINKNLAISENGFCLNPMTGESFSINPIGAEIIQLLRQELSPEQVVKQLCTEYNIDEATMEKDLFDFISIMKHHQLMQPDEKN